MADAEAGAKLLHAAATGDLDGIRAALAAGVEAAYQVSRRKREGES